MGNGLAQQPQALREAHDKKVKTLLCIAKPGQKATTESVEEMIYPTEYEPAQIPEKTAAKTKVEADKTKVEADKIKAEPRDFATGPIPSAWETRHVGSTLEIAPTLLDYNTSVTLMAGQFEMVGALTPKPNTPGPTVTRKLLVFCRADVLPVSTHP